MKLKLNLEAVLAAVDDILTMPTKNLATACSLWLELNRTLDRMLEAAKFNRGRQRRFAKVIATVRLSASQLTKSLANAKGGGATCRDWLRFAERDFVAFKDELMALREFLIDESDFLKFAVLRAQLKELNEIDPERLFKELHEAEAISERTWVLLMAQPKSWRKLLNDRELCGQLARISGWLLDLQESRDESWAKRSRHEGALKDA